MTLRNEDLRVDEPHEVKAYANLLSRVAGDRQPVIVRRGGEDFVAVVPLEFLELAKETLARSHAEEIARTIDWDRLVKTHPPDQAWFDRDEPKPF